MHNEQRLDPQVFGQLIEARYGTLTASQQKLARYLLRGRLHDPCFLSAEEIARSAGVSPATVARFVATLGFSGYVSLRAQLRSALRHSLFTLPDIVPNSTGLGEESSGPDDHGILARVLRRGSSSLLQALNHISRSDFDKALHMLLSANRVFVLGCRSSAGVALIMSSLMNRFHGNTFPLTVGIGDLVDRIQSLAHDDLLVAISWARYSRFTVEGTRMARLRGIRTLGITDREVSPLMASCDITLVASPPGKSTPIICLVGIVEALLAAVAVELTSRRGAEVEELGQTLLESQVFSVT